MSGARPLVEDDLKLFANFGTGGDRAEFYGHTNYASKKVTGGFYYRNPNNRGNVYSVDGGESLLVGDGLAAKGTGSANCPTVNIVDGTPDQAAFAAVRNDPNCFTFHQPFLGAPDGLPGGFTPQFGGDVNDYSLVSGVRGTAMNGLHWDISGSTGRSHVQTFIFDTVNASLGPESPTRFEPNLLQQTENSLNADMSYAASDMINVAGGFEWRNEQYHLGEGDQASLGDRPPTARRASAPPPTATTAPDPRTPAPGTVPITRGTATSSCTAAPTTGTSVPPYASRTSTTASARR